MAMMLENFDHEVDWSEFSPVPHSPRGVRASAHIVVKYHTSNFEYRAEPGQNCRVVGVTVTLGVSRAESWVVIGQENDALLRHEQMHYDIAAIGVRQFYNAISDLTAVRCANLDRRVRQIWHETVRRIRQVNDRYDRQTNHGLILTAQSNWEALIQAAKQRPNGTLANLPG